MARHRNEAPPGGDDKGPLFTGGTPPDAAAEAARQNEADTRTGPAGGTAEQLAASAAGRRTTRGMLPELKVIHEVYQLLADLEEPQRRFVLDFINGKFPKPPVPA